MLLHLDPRVTDAMIELGDRNWRVRRSGAGWSRYDAADEDVRYWTEATRQVRGDALDSVIQRLDGVPWRLSPVRPVDGKTWVALRRVMATLPDLARLELPAWVDDHLRSLGRASEAGRSGGLVIVSGLTGSGKTTLASAIFARWLADSGETGVTIEDPPELPLNGAHGETGHCYQIAVDDPTCFAPMLVKVLRWRPRMIFLGEVRDPEGATQLLRAASTGHVTLATLHSPSAVGAAERLISLLADAYDKPGVALAESLQMLIHVHPTPSVTMSSGAAERAPDEPWKILVEALAPKLDNQALASLRMGESGNLKDAFLRQNRRAAAPPLSRL